MEGSLVLALMLNEASSPVSSPTSRFTYQKALASKTYVGTSFAGPWMEDKRISSWWMVDLGEDHQLMCNYYTFRQWVKSMRKVLKVSGMKGSIDGKTWTDLRTLQLLPLKTTL
ncbi:hypothetical protein YC2023_118713 [Brassica napus]